MLPQQYRLRLAADIERVRRQGRVRRHPLIILLAAPALAGQSGTRFAFLASSRVGNAVKRNRSRRLLREAVRHHLPMVESGWDCMLIARPAVVEATYTEVAAAVADLLTRSRLLRIDASEY